MHCHDTGVYGAIRAAFSSGLVTDSSWKCSTTEQSGWKLPG